MIFSLFTMKKGVIAHEYCHGLSIRLTGVSTLRCFEFVAQSWRIVLTSYAFVHRDHLIQIV